MHKNQIEDLVDKYLSGTATEQETAELLNWYRNTNKDRLEWELDEGESEESVRTRIFENIDLEEKTKVKTTTAIWPKMLAAAVLVLAVTIALYFYKKPPELLLSETKTKPLQQDRQAGGNKAVLTLADGSKIVLDESKEGLLAQEAGTRINKVGDGQVRYDVSSTGQGGTILYNTITTPIGGKYQLTLPDGSQVWLNSASTLRFPTAFKGSSRAVELSGEAYFEVAKRSGTPFKVSSRKHTVEVLGTHFNLNAYQNEPSVKTTLLEGSVRVSESDHSLSRVLTPGQESRWNGNKIGVHKVDPQIATAWKEGYFRFDNADINTVMRQLSRWYGVNIRSEGQISPQKYGGAIDMDLSLKQVLEILENGKVNFKLEGNDLVVMP